MDFKRKLKLLKYIGCLVSLYGMYKYKKNIHDKYNKQFHKFD